MNRRFGYTAIYQEICSGFDSKPLSACHSATMSIPVQPLLPRIFRIAILTFLLLAASMGGGLYAQKAGKNKDLTAASKPATTPPDSVVNLAATKDSLASTIDTLIQKRQQLVLDSLKKTSELQASVRAVAEDSIVFEVDKQLLWLYGKANIKYEDIEVQGAYVDVDWSTQMVRVRGKKANDSSDVLVEKPSFKQGEQQYTAREMTYNFKSKKGRVVEARTQEGDGYILAEVVKRNADNSFFGLNGRYTTCNDEHPHFYIRSRKMKVIPSNKVISGPLNLVIEEFPIPIVIPFGFFPNTQKKVNGIVLPKYGNAQNRGYFLQGLGYYWGKSPYFNVLLTADVYTLGGWTLGAKTNYKYRTQTNGMLGFDYGVARFNEPTDPDFQKTNTWRLTWNHQQGINQTTNLSASISLDKAFNRTLSTNIYQNLQNNQTSSISFNKSRIGTLPLSLNASANAVQDINRGTVTVTLPNVALFLGQQTPFKNLPNKPYYEPLKQLGFSYSMNAENRVSDVLLSLAPTVLAEPNRLYTYTLRSQTGRLDTIQKYGYEFIDNNLRHNIPIATKMRLFKYINLTGNANFTEYWYTKTQLKSYDTTTKRVETQVLNGFAAARDFNLNANFNTTFYGLYGLKNNKRNLVVRQVFIPTVGYNYKPDFSTPNWGYYKSYQQDTLTVQYSRFVGAGPSAGESQSMTFGLNSSLEAKLRKKESFKPDFPEKEDRFERFRLLDNLGLNGSYNFAAKEFKLSDINLNARTSVFKNKLSLNFNGTLSPYAADSLRKLNVLMWEQERKIGRITNVGFNLSTSFQSPKSKKYTLRKSSSFDEAEYQQILRYTYDYIDFNIPWTVNINYYLTYSRPTLREATISNVLNLTGDVNLTDKWKIGYSTGYDFQNKQITENSRITIFRDLHCWDMSFSWVPLGRYQSYQLTINVKSGTLQDLRLNKQNQWQNRFREF